MIMLSVKASTLKVAAALAALGIVVAAAFWEGGSVRTAALIPLSDSSSTSQVSDASTNSGRIAFLKSFGWEVSNEPVEVVEVTIPQTFNTVYLNYNSIQKSQGYDLSKYRGQRVKRWTYDVKNYPGEKNVRANLLVYDGKVIGGDISTVALNGFMQGFAKKTTNVNTGIKPAQADIVTQTFDTGGKI